MADPATETDEPNGARHRDDLAEPWKHYTRHRTGSGWAHPLGRDQVRDALLDADAFVDYLVFSWYRAPRVDDLPPWRVLSVRRGSDARGGYGRLQPPITMTVYAVPAGRRQEIRQQLMEVWLPAACAWTASASTRDNAWSASDHEWTLKLIGEDLSLTEC